MKKQLLSLAMVAALFSFGYAQTTTYLDFEGATPIYSLFDGADFSIVDNPSKTGVNTSDKVAMTQKAETAQWWGGIAFPCGGTINFAADAQTFSIDVYSGIAGEVMCKVENGSDVAEVRGQYTTPGEWQTVTFDMSTTTVGVLVPDFYKQLVIFMGVTDNIVTTDVWYYDNVKGPGFTAGGKVDVTYNITDLAGTATSMAIKLSNDLSVDLTGTAGEGAVWTGAFTQVSGTTIMAPITYDLYVNDAVVEDATGLAFPAAGSAATTIARNYGSAPVGQNLLTNGGFDDIEGVMVGRTSNEWGMWTDNGGVAEVIDGVCKVTPVTDVDNWAMQVEQWNFSLENESSYTVLFTAYSAQTDRVICLTIEDPADNRYKALGSSDDEGAWVIDDETRSKWDINITTDPTEYELHMIVDAMVSNSTPKFAFLLAQSDDVVYIDDVSLVKDTDAVPETKASSSLKVYPNPAKDNFRVDVKAGTVVNVYNVTGQLMLSKVTSTLNETIDISGLTSGLYLVKAGNQAQRLVVR